MVWILGTLCLLGFLVIVFPFFLKGKGKNLNQQATPDNPSATDTPNQSHSQIAAASQQSKYKSAAIEGESDTDTTPDKPIAFIDLETTGLDPESDRITEVGIVVLRFDSNKQKGYSELVNPGRTLPDHIVKLTGITDEMLKSAQPASVILPEFFEYIGDMDIWSFNAKFDMGFLASEANRLGIPYPPPSKSFCVMELTKSMFPGLPSYSLQSLTDIFQIESQSGVSHRAGADAIKALQLWVAISSGKKPYAAQDIKVAIENLLIHPVSGEKLPDPVLILSAAHPEILKNWRLYKKTQKPRPGTIWTQEQLDFMNIYAPGHVGGSGLLAKLMNDQNQGILKSEFNILVKARYEDKVDQYVISFEYDY